MRVSYNTFARSCRANAYVCLRLSSTTFFKTFALSLSASTRRTAAFRHARTSSSPSESTPSKNKSARSKVSLKKIRRWRVASSAVPNRSRLESSRSNSWHSRAFASIRRRASAAASSRARPLGGTDDGEWSVPSPRGALAGVCTERAPAGGFGDRELGVARSRVQTMAEYDAATEAERARARDAARRAAAARDAAPPGPALPRLGDAEGA